MSRTGVIFPGQGSQKVGMARLSREFSQAALVFEEAEDRLKIPLRQVASQGPQSLLNSTVYAQPIILVTSLAHLRVLRSELDFQGDYYAGHSLGEITALVAAGVLSYEQALSFVSCRAQVMQQAFCAEHAAMAAVIGLGYDELKRLCKHAHERLCDAPALVHGSSRYPHMVDISAVNSSMQLVVSGSKRAVSTLKTLINQEHDRVRIIPLAVSAPFHSRYMNPAQIALSQVIQQLSFCTSHQVIANVSGDLEDPYESQHLLKQITAPVQWFKTLKTALSCGVDRIVEVGHSRVLTRMWDCEPVAKHLSLYSTADIGEFIRIVQSLT